MLPNRSETPAARSARAALIALLLLLCAPAQASDWTVDHSKSWLGFRGAASGTPFDGRFSRWEAQIAFDPARPEQGQVVVSVDMASAVTGERQADQALPQPAWFDAKAFPRATLTVTSFRPAGGNNYEAIGTLALRDVTKPIVMPVTIETDGSTLHATGRLDLMRTDYGVGSGTGPEWVALEVVAMFDVTAARRP